jgi:3-oxoacyl-(acyl-carrier-protein) synthase
MSPHFLHNLIPDTASAEVAITTGARGHNLAIVSACATGGNALGEAVEVIKRGDAHTMIAGGTEACLVPVVLSGFITMRALAAGAEGDPAKACRPFDKSRSGFVMAEGSCMMVLEDLDRARDRGAKIYAEIIGYAASSDAFHLAAPSENGEGAARAMTRAIRKAGIAPERVDYINAHGTGTALNDKFETAAIKSVFGEHAYKLAVSSTKSMTGHMMGAAGAVEALACALAIKHSIIPPTMNYETPDPDCDLDYVPNVAREVPIQVAMSNSIGLGGHNSCLILSKFVG